MNIYRSHFYPLFYFQNRLVLCYLVNLIHRKSTDDYITNYYTRSCYSPHSVYHLAKF